MKTVLYFMLTICISVGAFFAATNMNNPLPAFSLAFGIWVVFFLGWNRRLKKQAARRSMERQFEEYARRNTRKSKP
ncbi:hypothetical protein HDF18_08275 [Mucilaginibacter sp. X5P1]|uniref:hypothetical protein n=1 Tax=Mucilaginibacter sp. X5P1 TaxID=2723088 RepID=UPI001610F62F|nr:hypothetical protein [Mucilaginibacter sp. X5P1]MBB6137652.1 hypothetical protein [Mucilaginibacter sp. X5P1]